MKKILSLIAMLPLVCFAHGPTPQKAEESIVIDAPLAKVWAVASDFGAIANWHPALQKSTGEGGHASGASRTMIFKSGGVLKDELDDYSESETRYAYRMGRDVDITALPVSSLNGRFELTANAEGKTVVTWKARFYRAFTGNEPPAGQDDESAVTGVTAFFQTGLAGLKAKVEAK
ncbi:MAG: SRPBCC family protein [Methylophilaceae bacterium]